ncbi:MAG: TPR end-of-group domain-containing protein [Planctomycetota bacterium]
MGNSFPQGPSPSELDPGARWEIEFYEDILQRNPDFVEVLMLLGTLYTGNQMYRKGLAVDRRLAELRADDPIVHYNLACSYSLIGQIDEAFDSLFKAVELGYRDLEHMNQDEDLDGMRSDARYAALVERMRRLEARSQRGQT